jgi:crotonobetainyl-CoA:carnitine CoA-transferase CaiB-like acyl-CoA transferase
MRRVDLLDDPRFSSAAGRRLNFGALHAIIQSWILTFPDMARLDAQFDEAKIAMGEIRSIKELAKSEWSDYWGAVQLVPDRSGGEYRLPGRPWHFSKDELTPIGTPAFQGEHNREVFRELGVGETELQKLAETGALVTHRRALEPETGIKAQRQGRLIPRSLSES